MAVDGKTLRGAHPPHGDGRPVHLLAAMDHATRAVLAQRPVDGAPGEVPGFRPLLERLDLAAVVVTADALHTHADAAEFLVTQKQAHYLLVVKGNQCAARRLAVSQLELGGIRRDISGSDGLPGFERRRGPEHASEPAVRRRRLG